MAVKVGEVYNTNSGDRCTVVEYNGCFDITVEFNDEHKARVKVNSSNLRKGEVMNPYGRTVYKVGYSGEGKWKHSLKGRKTPEGSVWRDMLYRCYSEEFHNKQPSYRDCSVADSWHNFQSFADWFDKQYREDGWELDKDLKVIGNKEYSEGFCSFVPKRINTLLSGYFKGIRKDGLPVGVCWDKERNKYSVSVGRAGQPTYVGRYEDVKEARSAYLKAKQEEVSKVAEQFKGRIDRQVYENLLNLPAI